MALKVASILSDFLPTGKAWERSDTSNTSKMIDAISFEIERTYESTKKFYKDFNIIDSSNLAISHGLDYFIKTDIFTQRELQRIIVEYLNKEYSFKQIIEDFGIFINESVSFSALPVAMELGDLQFGDEFGDASLNRTMEVLIILSDTISCENYKKFEFLVDYFTPPYLHVLIQGKPILSITPFTAGYSQFGDELGELSTC